MMASRLLNRTAAALAGALLIAAAAAARADDNICVEHPRSDWMTEDKLAETATQLGYDVRKVEEEDGCWEVKGFDQQGNRVEVYFDPVSAEVMRIKD